MDQVDSSVKVKINWPPLKWQFEHGSKPFNSNFESRVTFAISVYHHPSHYNRHASFMQGVMVPKLSLSRFRKGLSYMSCYETPYKCLALSKMNMSYDLELPKFQ